MTRRAGCALSGTRAVNTSAVPSGAAAALVAVVGGSVSALGALQAADGPCARGIHGDAASWAGGAVFALRGGGEGSHSAGVAEI